MYKICANCNTKNLEIAKFCLSCEEPFIKTKLLKPEKKAEARKIRFEPKITVVDDDYTSPDDLLDGGASELEGIIKVQAEERPRGFKFEDVVGTMKGGGGRKALGRRSSSDRRSGKAILGQEGGNGARFGKRGKDI